MVQASETKTRSTIRQAAAQTGGLLESNCNYNNIIQIRFVSIHLFISYGGPPLPHLPLDLVSPRSGFFPGSISSQCMDIGFNTWRLVRTSVQGGYPRTNRFCLPLGGLLSWSFYPQTQEFPCHRNFAYYLLVVFVNNSCPELYRETILRSKECINSKLPHKKSVPCWQRLKGSWDENTAYCFV